MLLYYHSYQAHIKPHKHTNTVDPLGQGVYHSPSLLTNRACTVKPHSDKGKSPYKGQSKSSLLYTLHKKLLAYTIDAKDTSRKIRSDQLIYCNALTITKEVRIYRNNPLLSCPERRYRHYKIKGGQPYVATCGYHTRAQLMRCGNAFLITSLKPSMGLGPYAAES